MNLARLNGGVVPMVIVTLICANALRADAIDNTGDPDSLVIVPAPELDFGDLGLLAGSFLFEPNTMYDFTGSQVIEILSAITDPGQTVLPLNAPDTTLTTITIPDTGGESVIVVDGSYIVAEAPVVAGETSSSSQESDDAVSTAIAEPAAGLLAAGGLGWLALCAVFRVRSVNRS